MKNRKLQSYMYNGWRIKDALDDAVKNLDIVFRYYKKRKKSNSLFNDETINVPYLVGLDNNREYKLKLTKEEAKYFLELRGKVIYGREKIIDK